MCGSFLTHNDQIEVVRIKIGHRGRPSVVLAWPPLQPGSLEKVSDGGPSKFGRRRRRHCRAKMKNSHAIVFAVVADFMKGKFYKDCPLRE